MREIPIYFLGLLVSIFALAASAADAEPAPELTDTAYDITISQMSEQEWAKYVLATKKKYDSWIAENEAGSFGQFLNDKFLEIAPSALGGKIENLKRVTYWMALYKYFGEQPPSHLRRVTDKHKREFYDLSKNFSWEKMSEMVTKASKEYDIPQPDKK